MSTLQFIAEAFRRHLHRLASISEHDGYLAPVIEKRPTFSARVTALQDQRRRLLDEVDHVLADLDPQAADDPDAVALRLSCAKLANLMDTYERYREQETELIQDAFLREVGGES